mmetsp:Transcript_4962/g.8846  ORF Transcript_4962/g.8846 Transcript_4962/m.8846 type:complete len:101 (+) Transcript_4962:121-423(+)
MVVRAAKSGRKMSWEPTHWQIDYMRRQSGDALVPWAPCALRAGHILPPMRDRHLRMALEAAQHALCKWQTAEELVRHDQLPLVVGFTDERRLVRPPQMLK